MNAIAEKFEQFEWLTHGITAKSPNFEPNIRGTGEKPLNHEDRLGAIASMETQLAKSVTTLIVFDGKSESDYVFVRNHLAKIMINEAYKDKKREPEHIAIYHLAWLVARMVIDFALDPSLEADYTAQGRLGYAGFKSKISVENYRKTWKPYEIMMNIAIESAIDEASKAIKMYKKETYKA